MGSSSPNRGENQKMFESTTWFSIGISVISHFHPPFGSYLPLPPNQRPAQVTHLGPAATHQVPPQPAQRPGKMPRKVVFCWLPVRGEDLPWEPTTFIIMGYNPYFGGVKPSFFTVLGSKAHRHKLHYQDILSIFSASNAASK